MSEVTIQSTGPAQAEAEWHALAPDEVASRLEVDPAVGLTSAEADARRSTYGKNTFAEAKKASRWQQFSRQYADPMQIVLLAAGIGCLFLPGQFYTGVFLILLTLFNAWMAMNQEGKAEASAAALQGMMVVRAKVRRDGDLIEIPMEELVPGDIVNIEAGDLVPADARILSAATLEIDESALTGESIPTPKQVDAVASDAPLGDRIDMAFMNCQVTRGAGTILVTTTGMEQAPAVEQATVESGIILIKYWLEVGPDEQTRRLEGRIQDPRKVWKLTDMDLKSYSRWFDYSRARDAMLAATDTSWAPWYLARTDDKKRGRLNIISHLLAQVPYEPLKQRDIALPKRQRAGKYIEPDLSHRHIPTLF